MTTVRLLLATLLLTVLTPPPSLAQVEGSGPQRKPAPIVKGPLVESLGFLTGHWQGGVAAGMYDEEWSAPTSESMVGMYRFFEDDAVKFYEFMAIETTADGPVLRLRHFDPGLAAWEDKAEAQSLPLASFGDNQVVFESADKSERLSYKRDSDHLTVTLERNAGGHKGKQVFEYALVR